MYYSTVEIGYTLYLILDQAKKARFMAEQPSAKGITPQFQLWFSLDTAISFHNIAKFERASD